jgi:urease accessory protein
MRLDVGPDAVVEWVPEPAIPYAGSRYDQEFDVRVASGGVLWFWETIASGRMARGERWAFTKFSSSIWIEMADGARIIERMEVEPGPRGQGSGMAYEWDYVASAFLVSDALSEADLSAISDEVWTALESVGTEVLGGLSRPAAAGLVIKLAARTGDALRESLDRIWGVVRRRLWGQPIPPLRKY